MGIKIIIIGSICFIVGINLLLGTAYGSDAMLNQVQTAMQEMESIELELKEVEEENDVLVKEEKSLTQTHELLKEAEKNLKVDVNKYVQEARELKDKREQIKDEAKRVSTGFDQTTKTWLVKDNPALVDSLNQRWRNLIAQGKNLNERRKTLLERKKAIKERREGLNKAVMEWTKKKKENNAMLNELYGKYNNLINHVQSLQHSPFAQKLIRKAGASQECANIPRIENFEKLLNGAAEKAHRCLQKIWDGAR